MTDRDDTDSIRVPVSVAVAIGRIEEKLNNMDTRESRNDERLTRVENHLTALNTTVAALDAKQRPRVPWYVVAGGVSSIGAIVLAAWTLFTLMNTLADLRAG